ncbi:ARM repeat-containing protein [Penicillium argentinense]|uniref:ARM repeat-containing protein n=1 Tax=Penicillium argentinense TaxID=1131581 RepID=A0A9W9KEV9_9EURO|nr:ARM repeat-containing protein [Penicillium argentinense]KAJ5103874.1 ARM repeat-containing protein [Penicillium argentinense]
MAFKNGLSERLDELRFPSPRSPPSESAFPGYTSLSPGHSNFVSGFSRPVSDVRANLQRRFTTDSSKFSSSWNYLNQGTAPMADPLDLLSSFEKKRQHIEYMREQKRRFEEDMKLLDMQHEKEKIEMDQLARDLAKAGLGGPASEPTTPPEYREPPVSAAVSRPGRFSTSSVTSSPGFFNVFAPSSQLTSPQAPSHPNQQADRFVGHSVPGSRRNSEKEEFVMESNFRPGPSLHRYSLPSSNFNGQYRPSTSGFSGSGVDSFAATKHLFPNDDHKPLIRDEDRLSTPDIKGYIKMTEPDDKFPTLSRRDGSNILSANPDALDLAGSRTPGPDTYSFHSRHRSAHQSMPQSLGNFRLDQLGNGKPVSDEHSNGSHSRRTARHSLGEGFTFPSERGNDAMTPIASSRPTPLQSYSTNDLPTVKGTGNGFDAAITPPKTQAEHLHHHNTSMGRIPNNSVGSRSAKESPEAETVKTSQPTHTILQANAAPFGPQFTPASTNAGVPGVPGVVAHNALQFPMYGGYGAQPFVNPGVSANNPILPMPAGNPYSGYPNFAAASGFPRLNESPTRGGVGHRRQTESSDSSQLTRFSNHPLESYKGDLYTLCKDQHGCRFLQRKLEERNPDHVQLIFSETYMHVIELMTDPFGNYLCQKLLEFSNDEQRTALINNAAPSLSRLLSTSMKMIEFISTEEQTQTVIRSLQDHVVELVQDLNGNHVIQKCLNRLAEKDADFIYESVGANCVIVGTHRHGCCVLQRCIDHASGDQKVRLIEQITKNAFALVQDPFGNYVVQYILDLAEPAFTGPLCKTFLGNVPGLSKQKFSSNVIEKCLRTADPESRRALIDEMLGGNELEKMLRDSFANYVIQTAMDFAEDELRTRIIDAIRPILPSIRQTPHGRRIAGKMLASESNGRNGGQVTPNEMSNTSQAQIPKQMMQKPYGFQQGPVSTYNGHNAFNGPNALPTPVQSSSNTPPGGPADGSMFGSPGNAPGLGVQNQLFTYY